MQCNGFRIMEAPRRLKAPVARVALQASCPAFLRLFARRGCCADEDYVFGIA
jgi:hypothetical protein